jgi:hypothetical protein
MAQVKKLSVATVYGAIDLEKLIAASKTGDGSMKLMQVIGNAIGKKSGQSSYGDWTALMGQFQATNLETGEVSEAAQLFLPEVALTPLLVAMAAPEARGVEFALVLSARYVKQAKPGGVPYEYTWEPLLPPDANDPITRIKARLAALPAPAAASAPAADDKGGKAKGK